VKNTIYKVQSTILLLLLLASNTYSATNISGDQNNVNVDYADNQVRIGLGVDHDGNFLGEALIVFAETDESAWLAEAWASDGAGGLKLNYHWAEQEDAKIWKVFAAVDTNADHDRKATIGGGFETEEFFTGIYASAAITDERLLNSQVDTAMSTITGIENNHHFNQSQTTTTTTLFYERAYNNGIGARIGKYFDDGLWRIRGGLDYEFGNYSSS